MYVRAECYSERRYCTIVSFRIMAIIYGYSWNMRPAQVEKKLFEFQQWKKVINRTSRNKGNDDINNDKMKKKII